MPPNLRVLAAVFLAALLPACALRERGSDIPPELRAARQTLAEARKGSEYSEQRVGAYLDAAHAAASVLRNSPADPAAVRIYNEATASLAAFLYAGRREQVLGAPVTVSSQARTYELRISPGNKDGIWSPATFTTLKEASEVSKRHAKRLAQRGGLGGTLVGVRKDAAPGGKPERFQPDVGFTAPVTATVDFGRGRGFTTATLTLHDPAEARTAIVAGRRVPLAADFTAAIAYYPLRNELWAGFLAMIQVEKHLSRSGLYMMQPYDPDRIPVVFVHGLASTPQMWFGVINEVEADPELAGRFQFWAFQYPTGNPLSYSAHRMREELAEVDRLFQVRPGMILVGHSMGGLVSRMQATTTDRVLWDLAFNKNAEPLYRKVPADTLVKKALIFDADPDVKRLVFICVPHRGSELAIGSLGAIARTLINLPVTIVKTVESAIGDSLEAITGVKGQRMPTSIDSLSPKNPLLSAMDQLPIEAPHHSIIGDRGRGDTPNSSDGIVPYSSAHLDTAESELIVPGPHGSFDLPQTVEELRRILRLHLKMRPQETRTRTTATARRLRESPGQGYRRSVPHIAGE